MRPSKRKLSKENFDRVALELNRVDERTLEIAEKAMVHSVAYSDLSDEYGLTKARINQIVRRVWSQYLKDQKIPESWVRVELHLPPELVPLVEDLQEEAFADLQTHKKTDR